jgi:hypothetical protein
LIKDVPLARRPLVRLVAALGLGLGLVAASATTSSANCGTVWDPVTGRVYEIPCVDRYVRWDPNPPCLCPDSWSFIDETELTGSTSPIDAVALNPQPLPPRVASYSLR